MMLNKINLSRFFSLIGCLAWILLSCAIVLNTSTLLASTDSIRGEQELLDIDKELNIEYQKLKATRTNKAKGILLAEQKKWLISRDKVCELESQKKGRAMWIKEIARNLKKSSCVIEMSKSRVESLRANLDESPSVIFDHRRHGEIVEVPIRKIVNESGFKPTIVADQKICSTFLEDFIEGRNIFHIRPIIETDDYNSDLLKHYKDACPLKGKDLRTVWTVPVRDPIDENADEIPEYADVFLGQNSFKIYRLEIDDLGDEDTVFYYENQLDVKRNKMRPGRVYQSVIPDSCNINMFIQFNQLGSPKWTRNGVISYKGKNGIYVLEGYGMEIPSFLGLRLYGYSMERGSTNVMCRFSRPLGQTNHKEGVQ